jgi:MerR family transcriptional regulator, light-induced transcriptional regulator
MSVAYMLSTYRSPWFPKKMNTTQNFLSIAAVERETGLAKDTLRVWERRYNFPAPHRDDFGERAYPQDQVEKLRLVKRLMDRGYRPGKVVPLDMDVLRAMAGQQPEIPPSSSELHAERADLDHFIDLCKAHRADDLRRELSQSLLRLGMYHFVTDVIAPLTTMIGVQWSNGEVAVFEEHIYTECVQSILRNALGSIPSATLASRPRILLTTIPEEPHGLGLLMSEAIFALEGAPCTSLGVQTPIAEIVRAAKAQAADVVALSFSASVRAATALEALADLRAGLPPSTEIWAGGRCAVLYRKPPSTVKVLELHELGEALLDWRLRSQSRTAVSE